MPSAPIASISRASSITSDVLYPPAPASTGTLPEASSNVISTTRRCSRRVRVGFSPVVPQGTRKWIPASTWRRTKRRRAGSSRLKSRRNGVTSAVPQPRNLITASQLATAKYRHPAAPLAPSRRPQPAGCSSRSAEQHLAKLVYPFLAQDPLRRLHRPARKAQAAPGRVRQRDRIGLGIEANQVGARNRSRPVRREIDRARIAGLFHHLFQLQQRAGRGILFHAVVNLVSPGVIVRLRLKAPRGGFDQPQKHLHADGKVRAVNQARSRPGHCRPDALHLIKPSRGSDHKIYAQSRNALDIFHYDRGRGELDGNLNLPEILRRDPGAIDIVINVELQRNLKTKLGRQLLDQLSHLAVTDDGQPWLRRHSHAQSNTSGSSSEKNALCRASTAGFKSLSCTTKLTFRSEAPCEIMRTFTCSTALKIRPATPGVYRMLSPTTQMMAC